MARPKKYPKLCRVTISMDSSTKVKLQSLAKLKGMNLSEYIQQKLTRRLSWFF